MTSQDKKALRAGAGVVLAALLLLKVLPAGWRHWEGAKEELSARRQLLATAEGALADEGTLERSADTTRSRLLALAPRLISGGTEAEALADLNGRLALAGNRSRTRLLRSDQLPDSGKVARLRRVRLRLTVESDWSGLVTFFRAAVADPATLRISSVSVRSNEGSSQGPEILTGELEVSGWYLPAAPPREGR